MRLFCPCRGQLFSSIGFLFSIVFLLEQAPPVQAKRMQLLPPSQGLHLHTGHHQHRGLAGGPSLWVPSLGGPSLGGPWWGPLHSPEMKRGGIAFRPSHGALEGLGGGGRLLQGPLAFLQRRPVEGLRPRCYKELLAARRVGEPASRSRTSRRKQAEVETHGAPPSSNGEKGRSAAVSLRLEVLRKAKEAEEARSAFPIALRLPHPELVAGKK